MQANPATRESRGRNSAEERLSRNRSAHVWARKSPGRKVTSSPYCLQIREF